MNPADIRISLSDKQAFALRAAALIVRDAGTPEARLLMVGSDSADFLYSVGGAVEFGETVREALAREIREELGIDLPIGDLAAIEQSYFHGFEGFDWHQVCFCHWVGLPDGVEPVATSIDSHGMPERLRWVGQADLDAGTLAYPRLSRDALAGRWPGTLVFVERDGRYLTSSAAPDPASGRLGPHRL